ncbi:MAG: cytochrome c biogenesis protein CcsA [Candidatus Brocadiae bacterium]|nr:cytochrome c biogenesis protein CcsA [Candidatus Brocadiia bacterium]
MAPYTALELVLFWFGLVAYASAGATALGALLARREQIPHFLRLFTALGAVAHFAFLTASAFRTHSCPMFHLFEACVFAAAVAAIAALVLDIRFDMPAITAVVSPLATVVSGTPYLTMFGTAPQAIPESATLPFHIALVAVAYSAFLVSFTAGVLYLLQERELKRHSASVLVSALPSLEATNTLNARAVMVGFVLLTVGLGFGFTRAAMLDRPILPDGRVLGGVVTWAFYGGLTAMRLVRGYHGRSAARMSVWSFAVAAFTMFGGTLLGSGVHHP